MKNTNLENNVFSSQSINISRNFTKSPIYFTNPTTGIVYAISEIGYNYTRPTDSVSNSIPIYIPKEQYDRDLYLLKSLYKRPCKCLKKKQIVDRKKTPHNKKPANNNTLKLKKLQGSKQKPIYLKKNVLKSSEANKIKRLDQSDEYKNPLGHIKDMFYEMIGISSEETYATPKSGKLNKKKVTDGINNNYKEDLTTKNYLDLGTQVENPKAYIKFPTTTMKIHTDMPLKKPKLNKTTNNALDHIIQTYGNSVFSTDYKPIPIKFIYSIPTKNKEDKKLSQINNTIVNPISSNNNITPKTLTTNFTKNNEFLRLPSVNFTVTSRFNKPILNSPYKIFNSSNRSKRSLTSSESSKIGYNRDLNHNTTYNLFLQPKSYVSPPLNYIRENPNILKIKKNLTRMKIENKTNNLNLLNNTKKEVLSTININMPLRSTSKSDTNYKILDDNSNDIDNDNDYFISMEDFYFEDSSDESKDIQHRSRNISLVKENMIHKQNDKTGDSDSDDDDDDPSFMEMLKAFIYPFQKVLEKVAGPILGNISNIKGKVRKPKYPKYTTLYDKFQDNESSSSSTWFNWFGFGKDDKQPDKEQGWFDSWFDDSDEHKTTSSATSEDNDSESYWFSLNQNWFESKSKKPTAITTPLPSPTKVPILTIANPMNNPQKWIGILAQHIVNSTSTVNPILEDYEPKKKSYEKYQMWRLRPFGENQVKVLQKYKNSQESSVIEWLSGPTLKGLTDVLVPPEALIDFQGTLNYEDIVHEVIFFNVGRAIQFETSQQNAIKRSLMSVNQYKNYDDIIRYIENMQIKNPDLVELLHIGRSYEGRPLVVVKIATKYEERKRLKLKDKKNGQNSGVFIEGGVYGRQWISPASAIWIINEVVKIMKDNKTSPDIEFIKNTNWYIMPVLNPDGYQYSHDYDRFWHKSRSKNLYKPGILASTMDWIQQTNSEKLCYGVDLDRNWEYEWGKSLSDSDFPCSDFFVGPNVFSEPETKALSNFLMDYRKNIKLYISLQSYGHIITYPTKINKTLNSQRMEDLLDVAMVGNDALRKSNSDTRFKLDSTNDLVVVKSGSSNYFALYEVGVPFVYTLHLGDNGVHGYLLPSSHIGTAARDAFEIIKGMIDYI